MRGGKAAVRGFTDLEPQRNRGTEKSFNSLTTKTPRHQERLDHRDTEKSSSCPHGFGGGFPRKRESRSDLQSLEARPRGHGDSEVIGVPKAQTEKDMKPRLSLCLCFSVVQL